MSPIPSEAQPETGVPRVSLRRNFAWTFAGNAVVGASQWAVLSLIAKLGSSEMLGQYALAVAIATPIAMFSHLNLRVVVATDVEHLHRFGDYLAVRAATTLVGLAATVLAAFASGNPVLLGAAILLVGVALGADNFSDIFYGALQRGERMSTIARSMMARGLVSAAGVAVALHFTGSLVAAVGGLVAARLIVLLFHDVPRGVSGQDVTRSGWRAQWAIFRTALPLGLVLMLVSLASNVPRYAIEAFRGTHELGLFAAVAAFLTAGSTVVNALGQAATPRMARLSITRDLAGFRRLAWKLVGVAILLGAAGVLAALAGGGFILGLVYRAEYASHSALLAEVMLSAIFVYVAVALGYVITSARAFLSQLPLLVVVTATSAGASWLLVPAFGLSGAALAVGLAACVQIAGELLILRRVLRRTESTC